MGPQAGRSPLRLGRDLGPDPLGHGEAWITADSVSVLRSGWDGHGSRLEQSGSSVQAEGGEMVQEAVTITPSGEDACGSKG